MAIVRLKAGDLIQINRRLTDRTNDPEVSGVDWQRLVKVIECHYHDLGAEPHTYIATLVEAMMKDPPFEKRNAATAVLALYEFYRLNGLDLVTPEYDLLAMFETGQLPMDGAELAKYLSGHVRALPQDS